MTPTISIRQAAMHNACESGFEKFIGHFCDIDAKGEMSTGALLKYAIDFGVDVDAPRELHELHNNSVADLIWALRMSSFQGEKVISICRKTAIFAAESVLHIFENKYPNDKRPRKAIAAAKAYLAGDIGIAELREARVSAADAAYAADAAAAYADAIKKSIRDYFISLLIEGAE